MVSIGSGAVSILGLGIILAALSHANDYAYRQKTGLIRAFQIPDFQFVIDLGLILLELGILGAASLVGVRVLCGILAFVFGIHALRTRLKPRGH
jgi:hypothetical protein